MAAANEIHNGKDVEVIDIIHESLIENWDRLRQAIEEQRQQLQLRARFKLWLGEWLRNERQDGYLLLTDMQLAEARVLVEGRDIEVQSAEAREFYQRSLEHQEAERQKELQRVRELAESQQRRAQTFRWAAVVATILTLLALVATGIAVNQRQIAVDGRATATIALATSDASVIEVGKERDRANRQADIAATRAAEARIAQTNAEQQAAIAGSRQLAAQSTSELNTNHYEPAILLAIESGKITDTVEAFSSLRAAIANPWHSRTLLYGHTEYVSQATWSQDESKILTVNVNNTISIWYTHMADLLVAACTWVPRNFTWTELGAYRQGDYRPTCPKAPIPPDVIAAIQEEARQQIRAGQVMSPTQQLDQLNGWLQINGQIKSFGVDVPAFVAQVVATATAEAIPISIFTPTPSATPTPQQPTSPLATQQISPLPLPTVTPEPNVTSSSIPTPQIDNLFYRLHHRPSFSL